MFFFFFKQKTAYEMRISDWSSDVCSSDLQTSNVRSLMRSRDAPRTEPNARASISSFFRSERILSSWTTRGCLVPTLKRSEEHTSELQSLMRISYAVFCLKKKN